MAKKEFSYREEKEIIEKFKYIAKKKGSTTSNILNSFVTKYIENYEEVNGYIDPVIADLELKEAKEKGDLGRIQQKNKSSLKK